MGAGEDWTLVGHSIGRDSAAVEAGHCRPEKILPTFKPEIDATDAVPPRSADSPHPTGAVGSYRTGKTCDTRANRTRREMPCQLVGCGDRREPHLSRARQAAFGERGG